VSGLGAWLDGLLAQGFGGFAAPLWLAVLLPVVALFLWRAARRRPTALAWPALPEARAAGARRHDALGTCALALRAAAVLALVLALAEPLSREREVRVHHEGLDVVLVVDTSGSMRALDAQVHGEWRTRLELAQEVVARFAARRVADGDRVGLIVFGESAFTQCPLTSDGALLAAALERVEAGMAGEATALGDALALAVKRAAAGTGEDPAGLHGARPGRPRAGRVVVLLTDGRSNAGSVPTDVAAALAAASATRVHTVGIGSSGDVAMAHPSRESALHFERHDLDEATLAQIAASTGGRFFHARSSADLAAVYAEIDTLERVPRPAPPRVAGAPVPEPFLAGAGLLLVVELALSRGLARRLP
jgi:Ca-activated chloride channel homolog